MPDSPAIPDKLFFRIGEVSQLVGVEPYVLRYWESEFPGLSPKKSNTGQRMFRRKDVELLLSIKHLLYDQKFTIEGARKALLEKAREERNKPRELVAAAPARQEALFSSGDSLPDILPDIRKELADILKLLA
jgi:DNA-binding transcriptional MerR regulator